MLNCEAGRRGRIVLVSDCEVWTSNASTQRKTSAWDVFKPVWTPSVMLIVLIKPNRLFPIEAVSDFHIPLRAILIIFALPLQTAGKQPPRPRVCQRTLVVLSTLRRLQNPPVQEQYATISPALFWKLIFKCYQPVHYIVQIMSDFDGIHGDVKQRNCYCMEGDVGEEVAE